MASAHFPSAIWIRSPHVGTPSDGAAAPYFRKLFYLDRPVETAELRITALGLYEAEINGAPVGDIVFAPGWTDYRKRVPYQTFDVTALLRPGDNALGAILGDGWYCGRIAWKERQFYGDRPQLLAALVIRFQDGSSQNIVTDTSWKMSTGPILESDFQKGESYDARLELSGWSLPDYDARDWLPALAAPAPAIALTPALISTRRHEILPPVLRPSTQDSSRELVFDFGQNFTGRVRLTLRGERGQRLVLRHVEALNPDGSLYTENLRTAAATDVYICSGRKSETWEPRFTFHGFRYVGITGADPADLVEVAGVVLHTDLLSTGSFSCSNPLLNQLQDNILWGQKSNFLEVPMDCPQRDERLGWTGDALAFVRTACFNMDVRPLFTKWMQDIRDAQKPSGAVPYIAPDPDLAKNEDGGPAWSDATISCPWTIYLSYGDLGILKDHYESMATYMDFLAAHRCKGHIRSHPDVDPWRGFGDWLALDGSGNRKGGTPHDLIGTAYYAHDADLMARISVLLGKWKEASGYRRLHRDIVSAFQDRFIAADGTIAGQTQTAAVLALRFGLVPEDRIAVVVRNLVARIQDNGYHLATGFVGTPWLLDVLSDHGHGDTAYRLLEQETFPSWLFPVKNGATTIWERWDGWTPEQGFQDKSMNSFNHYAYGAVGSWMYRVVAGLDVDETAPGYRRILFTPQPGGSISWAEASLETPLGKTAIRWEIIDHSLHAKLEIPPGATGLFRVPQGFLGSDTELKAGSHEITIQKSTS